MEKTLNRIRRWDWTLIFGCIVIFFIYVFIHDLGRESLGARNMWDSYTLQALRWRDGYLDLGQNYDWLELAIFDGKYYLSFPPVPILPIYFLTFLLGENIPSNLIVLLYMIVSFGVLYRVFKSRRYSEYIALFWALFLTLGSNMASICVYGGVWFQAQAMCFMFVALSLRAAIQSRNALMAYIWLALAVGCRPFVICFFPMLMIYFYSRERKHGRVHWGKLLLPLIAPAIIGGIYMGYNYARFGSILEFGHNYLPEFLEAEYGQFHPSYIIDNFHRIFLRGITLDESGYLQYDRFDGFMFWLANPFYIVFLATFVKALRNPRTRPTLALLMAGVVAQLIFLMLHRTFGGWQFGARYTVDGLPYLALPLLFLPENGLPRWATALGLLAIAFNLYGAVALMTIIR